MPDGDIQALVQLVERLGAECPWTKQQDCHDMIYYTRKELLEVEDVFRGASKGRGSVDAADLTKELGDVLFGALMMIEVTRRNHSQNIRNAWRRRRSTSSGAGHHICSMARSLKHEEAGKDGKQSKRARCREGVRCGGREAVRRGCGTRQFSARGRSSS